RAANTKGRIRMYGGLTRALSVRTPASARYIAANSTSSGAYSLSLPSSNLNRDDLQALEKLLPFRREGCPSRTWTSPGERLYRCAKPRSFTSPDRPADIKCHALLSRVIAV